MSFLRIYVASVITLLLLVLDSTQGQQPYKCSDEIQKQITADTRWCRGIIYKERAEDRKGRLDKVRETLGKHDMTREWVWHHFIWFPELHCSAGLRQLKEDGAPPVFSTPDVYKSTVCYDGPEPTLKESCQVCTCDDASRESDICKASSERWEEKQKLGTDRFKFMKQLFDPSDPDLVTEDETSGERRLSLKATKFSYYAHLWRSTPFYNEEDMNCNVFNRIFDEEPGKLGRVTVGFIPAKTEGDVHVLSSFRPVDAGPDLSITSEIITLNKNWEVVIMDGESLTRTESLLSECHCDCVQRYTLAKKDVEPDADGIWRWNYRFEDKASDLVVVAIATCSSDKVRVHSGNSIIEYAINIVNGDGTHASVEEVGRSFGHTLLLILWEGSSVAFFCAWYKHRRVFGPFTVKSKGLLYAFSASVALYSLFLWCEMSHINAYGMDGVGSPMIHLLGMLFRAVGHSLFVILLLVLPSVYASQANLRSGSSVPVTSWRSSSGGPGGDALSRDGSPSSQMVSLLKRMCASVKRFVVGSDQSSEESTRMLAAILAAYAFTSLWSSYEIDVMRTSQSEVRATGWTEMSILATFITEAFVYFAFVQRTVLVQQRAGHDRRAHIFFARYMYGFAPFFVTSLLRLLVLAYCPPWSRFTRSMDFLWDVATLASFVAMGWLLWPSPTNWILFTDDQVEMMGGDMIPETSNPFGSILSISVKKKKTTPRTERGGSAAATRRDYAEIPTSSRGAFGEGVHIDSF
eukprot:g2664.t1